MERVETAEWNVNGGEGSIRKRERSEILRWKRKI
jgi:hypothetical protein